MREGNGLMVLRALKTIYKVKYILYLKIFYRE